MLECIFGQTAVLILTSVVHLVGPEVCGIRMLVIDPSVCGQIVSSSCLGIVHSRGQLRASSVSGHNVREREHDSAQRMALTPDDRHGHTCNMICTFTNHTSRFLPVILELLVGFRNQVQDPQHVWIS